MEAGGSYWQQEVFDEPAAFDRFGLVPYAVDRPRLNSETEGDARDAHFIASRVVRTEEQPPEGGALRRTTTVQSVVQRCDTVVEIMKDNMTRMVDRGNNLEGLLDKSAELGEGSGRFAAQARQMKNSIWWQQWVLVLLLLAAALVLMLAAWYMSRVLFVLIIFTILTSAAAVAFYWVKQRHRRLNTRMPVEVAMAVL